MSSSSKTSNTVIRWVPVCFPVTPYEVQRVLMEKVIEALQTSQNALLESPTGTGKTLSLLCSSRAWQESEAMRNPDSPVPVVIYASRTHAQLEQVLSEAKRTAYGTKGLLCISSRESVCVHSRVSLLRGNEQISACKQLVLHKECEHYHRIMSRNAVPDMEDLQKRRSCVYYASRDLINHPSTRLVLMPYNFLVEESVRRSLNLLWDNAVVIIDEAHNIEDVCEEASSFLLSRSDLVKAWTELSKLKALFLKHAPLMSDLLNSDDLRKLMDIVKQIEAKLFSKSPLTTSTTTTTTFSILSSLFAPMVLGFGSADVFADKLEMCADALNQTGSSNCFGLIHLSKSVSKVCSLDKSVLDKYFRIHFDGQGMHLWCFSASVCMDKLKQLGVRSILVASGTLSPLDSMAANLGLPFRVRLESPHVVNSNRVFLGCLPQGVTGRRLNGSFQHRNDEAYHVELGNTLITLVRVIPDGVLIFFSSYASMQASIQIWKRLDIWDRLKKVKDAVLVEEKGDMQELNEQFDTALQTGGGALLLAVCRGKASEGMDFKDKRCRGVILIGLPFPASLDVRVQHKKEFLQQHANTWYMQQAYRAVNQAIGRVIRHERDFGAILLLDERFTNVSNHLSLWLRPSFQHFPDGPKQSLPLMVQFFKRLKTTLLPELPLISLPPPLSPVFPLESHLKPLLLPASLPKPPRPFLATTAATAPAPTRQKVPRLEIQTVVEKEDGADFCNLCREALSPEKYVEFKLLLRNYHKHTSDQPPLELNAQAIRLFRGIQDQALGRSLLKKLGNFLPVRLKKSLMQSAGQNNL